MTGQQPDKRKQGVIELIGAGVLALVLIIAVGILYDWRLSLILLLVMVPAAIAALIIYKHPEKTGGRSFIGISNPNTLLDPFTGRRNSEESGERQQP